MTATNEMFVIMGPSGVGKTTLANMLSRNPKVDRLLTATSRPPREGEGEDDYHFVGGGHDTEALTSLRGICQTFAFGHGYKLPLTTLEAWLLGDNAGVVVLDTMGHWELRNYLSERGRSAVGIFILPSALRDLRMKTTSPKDKARRLEAAADGCGGWGLADAVILNDGTTAALIAAANRIMFDMNPAQRAARFLGDAHKIALRHGMLLKEAGLWEE